MKKHLNKIIEIGSWLLIATAIGLIFSGDTNNIVNGFAIGLSLVFDSLSIVMVLIIKLFVGLIDLKNINKLHVVFGSFKRKKLIKMFNNIILSFDKSKKLTKPFSMFKHFLWGAMVLFIGLNSHSVLFVLALLSAMVDTGSWMYFRFSVSKLLIPTREKDLKNEFSWSVLKSNIKKVLKENQFVVNNVVLMDDCLAVCVVDTLDIINKPNTVYKTKSSPKKLTLCYLKKDIINGSVLNLNCGAGDSYYILETVIKKEILETLEGCKRMFK